MFGRCDLCATEAQQIKCYNQPTNLRLHWFGVASPTTSRCFAHCGAELRPLPNLALRPILSRAAIQSQLSCTTRVGHAGCQRALRQLICHLPRHASLARLWRVPRHGPLFSIGNARGAAHSLNADRANTRAGQPRLETDGLANKAMNRGFALSQFHQPLAVRAAERRIAQSA